MFTLLIVLAMWIVFQKAHAFTMRSNVNTEYKAFNLLISVSLFVYLLSNP